jgi:hypothetical protein
MNRGEQYCQKRNHLGCALGPKLHISGGKHGGMKYRGERAISRIAMALYFFFSSVKSVESVESVEVHRKRPLLWVLWAMCLRERACRASEHLLSYLKNRTKDVLSALRSFGISALDIKDVLSPLSSPTAARSARWEAQPARPRFRATGWLDGADAHPSEPFPAAVAGREKKAEGCLVVFLSLFSLSLFSTPLGILFQFDAPQVNPRVRQTQRLNKLALKRG